MTRERLRIAIMVDSETQPAWVFRIVQSIKNSDFADLVLVIVNDAREKPVSLLRRAWIKKKFFLYKMYTHWDKRFFKVEPDAFKPVNLSGLLGDVPRLKVLPVMKKYSDYFSEDDIRQISKHNLDVALRFGFRILRGDILTVPKYGIWSYHHGDSATNRGGPPGFWEVMEKNPVTGSTLQILTEDLDAGKVIYRSFSQTNRRSVNRNRNTTYWKSTAFVMRKLRNLYEDGPTALEENQNSEPPSPYSNRLYRNPGNLQVLPFLRKHLVHNALEKIEDSLGSKQWFIGYSFCSENSTRTQPLYKYRTIIPPKDRSYADPFPLKYNDKYFIFLEEKIHNRRKACISVIEMNSDGTHTAPGKVLEEAHHLSYPFLFRWKDDLYMIPESGEANKVQAYKCVSFPDRWEPVSILIENVRAVDATLCETGGKWWMFVNIAVEGASTFDELHLFHSDSPLGPWTAHKKNPVKSDCRNSRPAGNLFFWNGNLYRPAQDCSVRYGYAIALNKIISLNTEEYSEQEVSKIYPAWHKDIIATHIWNQSDGLAVVDGMRRTGIFGR